MSAAVEFEHIINEINESIRRQMESRCVRGSNELRNAAMLVLRGQGSGRSYKLPGTYKRRVRNKATGRLRSGRYYTASAPGSPPAVRTGAFRNSWQPMSYIVYGSYISRVESDLEVNGYILGSLLEDGTSKMAPRPHHDRILDKAAPKILKIYNEPYF